MKPKILHQQAMDFSFKAKQALDLGDKDSALELYTKAAELECSVAEFYFDKPELEPTRSILIRSAAFLCLKAGQIKRSQDFIFFGLLNITDELIKVQLSEALEISISLKNFDIKTASENYGYLSILRQRSTQYILEPLIPKFGTSVSLEMVMDFSESYLKSIKAYAVASFKRLSKETLNAFVDIDAAAQKIKECINPLITDAAHGSFKFSIANNKVKVKYYK